MRIILQSLLVAALFLAACTRPAKEGSAPLTELSSLYSGPVSEWVYSHHVKDSFRIFHSVPESYFRDSTRSFPVIFVLDANAYIEAIVSQLRFANFIEQIPPAIVIGIGYSDFPKLNAYRDRDYTYPKMENPDWERSGGAVAFSEFIDNEIVPSLKRRYRIDWSRSVICGHSLGGYFTLFYATRSPARAIHHAVCASPSLAYASGFIFRQIADSSGMKDSTRIYVSMGGLEMGGDSSAMMLAQMKNSFRNARENNLEVTTVLYTGFDHMDAAIPGIMKGLEHVLRENDE